MPEIKCPKCGGERVNVVTRIVGYFSRVANWSKSKVEELRDREKGDYAVPEEK